MRLERHYMPTYLSASQELKVSIRHKNGCLNRPSCSLKNLEAACCCLVRLMLAAYRRGSRFQFFGVVRAFAKEELCCS
jgi:hypothetical protein